MIQFYDPNIATTLELNQQESQHAVRVLRLKEGDMIAVIDGLGCRYECMITLAHQKRCAVEIVTKIHMPNHWGYNLEICFAPTKNMDRNEWMVEKLTEIGVDRITPLLARFSERKEIKQERLDKIVVAAMKQSLKTQLPLVEQMTPIKEIILREFDGDRFIAYCDKSIERKLLTDMYKKGSNALIMIGPEGDFSKEEITLALERGFIPISLGDSRLRTETAAVVACNTVHILNQL
ncbi:MAG: 16S rRNA (uracil(1498)-N(3))-methyltransferase [Bacteroidales bacterium]